MRDNDRGSKAAFEPRLALSSDHPESEDETFMVSSLAEAAGDPIGPGDIVFTAYESDTSTANGKYFEFVLLKDVSAGTSIYFTDNGYRTDTGTFRTVEEFLRWTAQSDLKAGTKVAFLLENDGANAASAEWTNVTYFGSESTVAAINFSTNGDQIHALINPVFGSYDSVGGTPIASLDASGGYVAPYTDTGTANQTGLPSGLSVGTSAIAIGNVDNARYVGPLTGTPEQIRAAVNNVLNWVTNNLSMNTPAFTQHFAGDVAEYLEKTAAVSIDVGQNLLLFDDSFNMNNGQLTVSITGGKLATEDQLGISAGGAVTVVGATVSVNGIAIGTVSGGGAGGGDLVITFASSGVTAGAVQEILRKVTYLNSSDAPSTAQRTITTTLVDGDFQNNNGNDTMVVTTAVNVTAIQDPSIAISDVSQREGNGGTTELTFTVTRTGGTSAFTVDFATSNGTATAGTDYVATSGTLSFAAGENSKTITVLVSGDTQHESNETINVVLTNPTGLAVVADGTGVGTILDDDATGDGGDNVLTGTPNGDTFMLQQGGNDTALGLGGNDGFYFGAAYTSADVVNGGDGTLDQIGLQGNYGGGVTLGSITDVELVVMISGKDTRFGDTAGNLYDYNIIATDGSVAAGKNLILQGNRLEVGEDFTFDGSAETDGTFTVYGGFGVDNFTGGSGAAGDGFFFGQGRFGSADTINGGGSNLDQLGLQGNFAGANAVTFGAGQLTSVEFIVLLTAADTRFGASGGTAAYDLTMHDGNVAAGQQMIISANKLAASEVLTFNGAAESDGSFRIFSGAGNDVIIGSQNGDEIYGGLGNDNIIGGFGNDNVFGGTGSDTITGGAGSDFLSGGGADGAIDKFVYAAVSDSPFNSGSGPDTISQFEKGIDKIDLSQIDAIASTISSNDAFTFIGSAAFSGVAGQLRVDPNIAGATGAYGILGDTNGDMVPDLYIIVSSSLAPTSVDFFL